MGFEKIGTKLINKIENTHPFYLLTILVLTAFLVYGASLFNGFVWDDEEQIVKNAVIQNLSNIPFLFTSSTFNTGGAGLAGIYYKPLMPIVFSLNFFLWKANPFGFHFFDVMIHIINGVLVFFLFKKFFPKTISFFLSLIFIIHPANTESVSYISSTQELLYTFFLLLTLLMLLNSIQKTSFKNLFLMNLFVFLSLLSKESGIVVLPIIAIFTYLFNRPKTFLIGSLSFLTFLIYLFFRFAVAKTPLFQHSSIIPIANASLIQRLQTMPFELVSYLRLLFFPKDLFVAQHLIVKSISDPRFYLGILIDTLFLGLLIFLFLKNRSKLFLFFLCWLFFSFLILLNLYPLDMTIAERWLYGPMIGVLGIIALLISGIFKRYEKAKIYFLIGVAIIIPVFSFRTFIRTFDWKSNLSLFSKDEESSKDSFDLQNNLGVALFRNGNLKEAKKHFEKSIMLSPEWWTSYNNLGVIYERQGNLGEAKRLYDLSIKNGNYYLAYENLALLKFKTEKPEQALTFVKEALRLLPHNEMLNKIAAIESYKVGKKESAKIYAQKAYLINNSQDNYLLLQAVETGTL